MLPLLLLLVALVLAPVLGVTDPFSTPLQGVGFGVLALAWVADRGLRVEGGRHGGAPIAAEELWLLVEEECCGLRSTARRVRRLLAPLDPRSLLRRRWGRSRGITRRVSRPLTATAAPQAHPPRQRDGGRAAGDVPDNPVFQQLSDRSRVVVSEPLGDLAVAWNPVPESSWGVVENGDDTPGRFTPREP